jgi:hypothetical protein
MAVSSAVTQIENWLRLENPEATLDIENDPYISTLPPLPETVQRLRIDTCERLVSIHRLPVSLRHLQIIGCPMLEILPAYMPPKLFYCSIYSGNSFSTLPIFMDALTHLFIHSAKSLHAIHHLPSSLEELYIRNTRIHTLPRILPPNLRKLVMPHSDLRNLPPLPDCLDTLHIKSTHMSELPPLPNSLRTLHVSNMTSLECLPNPLPPLLNELYADNTALTTLPDLPPHLRLLYIDSTPIHELPILPPELRDLSLAHTPIRELPYLSQDLMFLNLEGTPIKRLHASQFKHINSLCFVRTHTLIDEFLSLPSTFLRIEFTNPDFSLLDVPIDEYFKQSHSRLLTIVFRYKGKVIEIQPHLLKTDESLLKLQEIMKEEMENMKARVVLRTRAFKEDLMIKTWHPSRVEAWCGVRFDTIDDE